MYNQNILDEILEEVVEKSDFVRQIVSSTCQISTSLNLFLLLLRVRYGVLCFVLSFQFS